MRLLRRIRYVWRNFDHPLADHCLAVEDKLAIVQREREYAYGEKNRLLGEVVAQRRIIADLGRQLHGEHVASTVPMPRVRSQQPAGTRTPVGDLLKSYEDRPAAWAPEAWRT